MCIGSGFFSGSYGACHSALSVGLLDEVVLAKKRLLYWVYCHHKHSLNFYGMCLVTSGNSNIFSLRD